MEKLYRSTRNKQLSASAKRAIVEGIASDGGLYVYDDLTSIRLPFADMMNMDYYAMAEVILQALLPDFSEAEVKQCVQQAYRGVFDDEAITPLKLSGNDAILELFHGPTSAFKDVGLQMLPQLMSTALKQEDKQKIMILTATSGDTGKAALEGFKNVERVGITVFYPDHGVSEIQRLQMVTQEGSNTAVCAIKGNFDDAQSSVKEIFNDAAFTKAFEDQEVHFSSANSINIGRLIPQIVYYFDAYKQLVNAGKIKLNEKVNFCVPTGNFGNILAGYFGKLMGLPVHKFIVASNANNVLFDFINEGVYDRRRPFHKTLSPSMDILVSSNLERLLYYMSNKNDQLIHTLMNSLQKDGHYQVSPELLQAIQSEFYAGYAEDDACAQVMKRKFLQDGYVLDPHTAVGYCVMEEYQKQDKDHVCVLLSTASPYKFTKNVYTSLFGECDEDEFKAMEALEKATNTTAPKALKDLQHASLKHQDVIEKDQMRDFIAKKTEAMFQ